MSAGGVQSQYAGVARPGTWVTDQTLVGVSSLFKQVLAVIDGVSGNDCIALLEGESGTGKELLARRVHQRSDRSGGPFIPVNCAAVNETIFESQFYGHLKGAFTGASTDTLGIVRASEGGTLLLDEIGDLPLHLQPKLLRVLHEREVTPVGGAVPIPVDVRFVASTNRSLAKSVAEGLFRSDLYHRLNIVRIHVPPLRSRPDDIDALLEHYLGVYAKQYRMPRRHLGRSLRRSLRDYPWPGNVRELCTYVERLYATDTPPAPPTPAVWEDGYIPVPRPAQTVSERVLAPSEGVRGCSLAEAEAGAIRQALRLTGNNRSAAAKILEIHRSTLLRKIRLFGLDD